MKLFIQTIYEIVGWKALIPILLILFQALFEGIGVMMLVPMLGFVGIASEGGITGSINSFFTIAFDIIGFPKNLITVLFIYVFLISCREMLVKTKMLLSSKIQHNAIQTLRSRLYVSISQSEWLFFVKTHSSDYAHSLLIDVNRLGSGANTLIQFISATIILGIYIIIAMSLSFTMTILALFCGAIVLFVLKNKIMSSIRTGKVETGLGRQLHLIVMEQLGGMKLSKIFCAEERSFYRFRRASFMLMENFIKFANDMATTRMWFGIISVVIVSIFVYVSIEVISVSTVTLLLLLFIFSRMMPQITSLQQGFQQLLHVKPALTSFLDMEQACKDAAENIVKDKVSTLAIEDNICFKNIIFRYNKENEYDVLKSVSFTIRACSTMAFAGSSGSGKSTIADLLMGLLYPDSGEILIDGKLLSPELLISWRQSVAYVPQDNFLLNDTVRENLLWASPGTCDDHIREALEHAAAKEFIGKLPQGLDTVIGDRGVRLSGGERQRIALARALLTKPQLLILDEATSSLDVENEKRIQESIEALHGNMTIVIIAHRLSTIRNADQIIVIDDGRVVETGTWDELISKENGRFLELSRI